MKRITQCLIAAFALLTGMLGLVLPTQAAEQRLVTGNVAHADGGEVQFFASCQDYYDENSPLSADFVGNAYSVGVPDGTYRVRIIPDNQPDAVASWHSAQAGCELSAWVTVTGDTVVDLVAATGSLVSGTVQAPGGSVSRGALAWFASCEEYYGLPGWPGMFSGGSYSTYLADGTYRVLFYPEASEYPLSYAEKSWHAAKPSCSQAQEVTISGNTTVNISVAAGKTVNGTVRSGQGFVNSGDVFFYAACQDVAVRDYPGYSAIVNGTYEATLPPGTYRVRIQPSSAGVLESWHGAQPSCDAADTVTITADTRLDLIAVDGTTPGPTAPTTPSPTSPSPTSPAVVAQTAKRPPKRIRKGQATRLAKKTGQGSRITWKSRTKAVCKVRRTTLTLTKSGVCKVKAAADAIPGYLAYSKLFTIRVK